MGVKILQLFVLDLIGRSSRRAKIFELQSTAFKKKTVVTVGVKCVAISLLVLLNIYFIFSCMLYGRDKGTTWQQGWVIASMGYLFIDVMIRQVNIALVVFYFIPTSIFDTMSVVKQTIHSMVDKTCHRALNRHASMNRLTTFSAPDYLFVSTRVARAFPGIMESELVLSYSSTTVSAEQSKSWKTIGDVKRNVAVTSLLSALTLLGCL